jgi:hypothetical protein
VQRWAATRHGLTLEVVYPHWRQLKRYAPDLLPEIGYPAGFQVLPRRWVVDGTLERVLEALDCDLTECGKLALSDCFIDGTFVVAKNGADAWERPSGAAAVA